MRAGTWPVAYIRDARSPPASSARASFVMSRNLAKDTAPELALRRALWAAGLRGYRKHPRGVPGRPDIVFPRAKVAIFVHGCFWHGCPRHARIPKQNTAFWAAKFEGNQARDARKEAELKAAGWRVMTVWEHDIRDRLPAIVAQVGRRLASA